MLIHKANTRNWFDDSYFRKETNIFAKTKLKAALVQNYARRSLSGSLHGTNPVQAICLTWMNQAIPMQWFSIPTNKVRPSRWDDINLERGSLAGLVRGSSFCLDRPGGKRGAAAWTQVKHWTTHLCSTKWLAFTVSMAWNAKSFLSPNWMRNYWGV